MGTWAVIVTYRPERGQLQLLLQALEQEEVAGIAIIDNGSPAFPELRISGRMPVEVSRLPANCGIAAGQNEGIRIATENGARYVLLLDQDSVPEPGMVASLRRAIDFLRSQGSKVACVGPRLRGRGKRELSRFRALTWWPESRDLCASGNRIVECDDVISSGSLIPVETLAAVGAMEEDLFIDHVDSEWCWRARAKGYGTYGLCDAVLVHRLGEGNCRIWIGRWRTVFRHKPFRYYYIFRNTILLARRNYISLRWVLFQLARLCVLFISFGFRWEGAGTTRRMMWMGTLDGLRGAKGALNERPS